MYIVQCTRTVVHISVFSTVPWTVCACVWFWIMRSFALQRIWPCSTISVDQNRKLSALHNNVNYDEYRFIHRYTLHFDTEQYRQSLLELAEIHGHWNGMRTKLAEAYHKGKDALGKLYHKVTEGKHPAPATTAAHHHASSETTAARPHASPEPTAARPHASPATSAEHHHAPPTDSDQDH